MRQFDLIEHTADVGIKAYGRTLEDLFRNACAGMIYLLIGKSRKHVISKSFELKIDAESTEEMLVCFLSEVLFRFTTENCKPEKIDFNSITNNSVSAVIGCSIFDNNTYDTNAEIKAVTYHNLSVKKDGDIFETSIIFDT